MSRSFFRLKPLIFPVSLPFRQPCFSSFSFSCPSSSSSTPTTSSPYNFTFGGCGFLLPYYIGVAKVLEQYGYLTKESKLAGASGGAILAASYVSGIPLRQMKIYVETMSAECRVKGTFWQLETILSKSLQQYLPKGTYTGKQKPQCGRLTVATTQVWPQFKAEYITHFTSDEDAIQALLASSYIPSYSSAAPARKYKGGFYVDGTIPALVPDLPGYIKVSAFPANVCLFYYSEQEKENVISPSLLVKEEQRTLPLYLLVRYSLMPSDPIILETLYEMGKKSAVKWIAKEQKKLKMIMKTKEEEKEVRMKSL